LVERERVRIVIMYGHPSSPIYLGIPSSPVYCGGLVNGEDNHSWNQPRYYQSVNMFLKKEHVLLQNIHPAGTR
jgi:hypothetical protein